MKTRRGAAAGPPNSLPAYRILTGPDDAAFCHRVSEALALGYELYGSPAATFNGTHVIVAQALVWPTVRRAKGARGA
jgi:hypothetical protein